jgi:hypothetical protein
MVMLLYDDDIETPLSVSDACCVIVLPSRSGAEALVAATVLNGKTPTDSDTLAPCTYAATPFLNGSGWSHVWVTRARALDARRCAALLGGSGISKNARVVAVGMDISRVANSWLRGEDDVVAAIINEVHASFDEIDVAVRRSTALGELQALPLRVLLIGNAEILAPRGDVFTTAVRGSGGSSSGNLNTRTRLGGGGVGVQGVVSESALSEAQCAALFCFVRSTALILNSALIAAPSAAALADGAPGARALIAGARALMLRGGGMSMEAADEDDSNAPSAVARGVARGAPHRCLFSWGIDTFEAAANAASGGGGGGVDFTWASSLSSSSSSLSTAPPSFTNKTIHVALPANIHPITDWAQTAETTLSSLLRPSSSAPSLETWAATLTMTSNAIPLVNTASSTLSLATRGNATQQNTSAGVGPRASIGARRSLGGGGVGARLSLGGGGSEPITPAAVAVVAAAQPPPLPKDPKLFFTNLLANVPRAPRGGGGGGGVTKK